MGISMCCLYLTSDCSYGVVSKIHPCLSHTEKNISPNKWVSHSHSIFACICVNISSALLPSCFYLTITARSQWTRKSHIFMESLLCVVGIWKETTTVQRSSFYRSYSSSLVPLVPKFGVHINYLKSIQIPPPPHYLGMFGCGLSVTDPLWETAPSISYLFWTNLWVVSNPADHSTGHSAPHFQNLQTSFLKLEKGWNS
jgi:hypothetical protein